MHSCATVFYHDNKKAECRQRPKPQLLISDKTTDGQPPMVDPRPRDSRATHAVRFALLICPVTQAAHLALAPPADACPSAHVAQVPLTMPRPGGQVTVPPA